MPTTHAFKTSLAAPDLNGGGRTARPPTGHRASWLIAGALSALYLSAVAIKPEEITHWTLRAPDEARSAADVAILANQTAQDVAALGRTVNAFGSELTALKAGQTTLEERERSLSERIASTESRVDKIAQSALNLAPAAGPAVMRPTVAGRVLPAESPRKTAETARAIETGSLPAPVAPGGGAVGVQIGAGPSIDAVRLTWSLLNDRHKATLKALEPRIVATEGGNYQLVAGPFASDADAAKACATLRQRGVPCRPAEFKGDAL